MRAIYANGSVLPFRTDLEPEDYLAFIDPLVAQLQDGAEMGAVGYLLLLKAVAAAFFHSGFEYEAQEYLIVAHLEDLVLADIAANN